MDSCLGVEQDLDNAVAKFTSFSENTNRTFQDLIDQVENFRREIANQAPDTILTPAQSLAVSDLASTVKQSVFHMTSEHRKLHATVSRVGRSIDRHFIAECMDVAPKAESFCSDENRPLIDQAIAQHLYRQGLEEVADKLVAEAGVKSVERVGTYAVLQRCATALDEGDPSLALDWVQGRAHQLQHSPLLFTLHRMRALKLARSEGVGPAVEYSWRECPAHAACHEHTLQDFVSALAWCSPRAPPPPAHYEHLLSLRALGAEASELFIREACSLLQTAPESPLAGAMAAGTKVLPALHDIRANMRHPYLTATWPEDGLPEVDLGDNGNTYHSVFACPILRQQTTGNNPPVRLLCGHVISKEALNKLTHGSKLKCPYCPVEQSPSQAREIYFS